jgi:hypothetical protein
MDVANITFLGFTFFTSLRIVSYFPQIHRVALDCNGASAISYSTWSLWTCANVATALYAAINLRDPYLSAVSSIYAVCCVVVIVLTMLKRKQLHHKSGVHTTAKADRDRAAAFEAFKGLIDDASTSALDGRRPNCTFEHDAAALARQIVWRDVRAAVTHRRAKPATARQVPNLTPA